MGTSSRLSTRYKAILRVNELARTALTVDEAFRGMCRVLINLLPFDLAALGVYDPDQDALTIQAVYGPHQSSVFQLEDFLRHGSIERGWPFQHKNARVRRDLTKELRFQLEKQIAEQGYRFLCSVPLTAINKSIGVVTVLRVRKNQFSAGDAELVQELSNQITMAILSRTRRCPIHPGTKLLCPRCLGSAGGRSTVEKHREDLSRWGQKGGRGHKKRNMS